MPALLAPPLLWSGAVLLYAAWWRRVGSPASPRSARPVALCGFAMLGGGLLASIAGATGRGAGFTAALAHLTAAATLVAIVVPLLRRPRLTMAAVACFGVLMGLLEGTR